LVHAEHADRHLGIFAAYCRWDLSASFTLSLNLKERGLPCGAVSFSVFRLSVLAIFLFALDVHLFHIKTWLQVIPSWIFFRASGDPGCFGLHRLSVTIWYFAFPAYDRAFHTGISRRSFITSNLKLNVPILFPWSCCLLFMT